VAVQMSMIRPVLMSVAEPPAVAVTVHRSHSKSICDGGGTSLTRACWMVDNTRP
jgi:hypothetical protein